MRSYQLNKRSSQISTPHDKQKQLSNIYLVQININILIPIEPKILKNISNQNSTW